MPVMFSPPAWGWSELEADPHLAHVVFPTRVGMVRDEIASRALANCFPHPRGDGPVLRAGGQAVLLFSPPAWGWSEGSEHEAEREQVFPTRVGMVRPPSTNRCHRWGFPHPRGDGPE